MAMEAGQTAPYVFLSYASADREWALHIAELLEARGVAVWIDRKSIAGGTSWSAEIVRGIRGCATFLVACSPAAMSSPNVQQEIQVAFESRRPILPLLVEPMEMPESIVYALAGRQWIEVGDRPDDAWLLQALRALRGLGIQAHEPALATEDQSIVGPTSIGAFLDSVMNAAPRHNLPAPVASFVGRVREVAAVKERLQTTRLVTLTGTGGCGKTRLALEVAAELLDAFADGVWLVELAPLSDSALVPGAVAAALGVREGPGQPIEATLRSFLRVRQLLLILDNCEHLIEACAQLADAILRGCPAVRILATSREALGISGEASWRVPSLAVPPVDQHLILAELAASEAICLFVERARAVQPKFSLTQQNASIVAQLCRRLDGIPLALELAATRVKALAVEQIAARLDQRFRLLTGGSRAALPRQQTLAALVSWSYDLLTEAERTLFNRLAVFSGSFALEAVEAICADEDVDTATIEATPAARPPSRPPILSEDVLDLLAELVDKSLVVAEGEADGGSERYRLLETLRQYGQERLVATGEAETVHRRHAAYYLDVAEQCAPYLRRAEQLMYLARLDRERDNLYAALRWFLDTEQTEEGLRFLEVLRWFLVLRESPSEALAWNTQFLQLPGAVVPSATRANVLAWSGASAEMLGDVSAGRALFAMSLAMAQQLEDDQALALAMFLVSAFGGPDKERWYHASELELAEGALARFRAAGDRLGIAESLCRLGHLAFLQGEPEQSHQLLTESLAVARTVGDRQAVAIALEFLGLMASAESDAEAEAALKESLRLYRELGVQVGIVSVENLLGRLDCLHRRYASAREHYRASLRVTKDWAWVRGVADSLNGLAVVAAGQSQPERALRLAAASARLGKEAGIETSPPDQAELDRSIASARVVLGEEAAAAARAEGETMTLEEAAAYALEEEDG